jgi:hypothetical protein
MVQHGKKYRTGAFLQTPGPAVAQNRTKSNPVKVFWLSPSNWVVDYARREGYWYKTTLMQKP